MARKLPGLTRVLGADPDRVGRVLGDRLVRLLRARDRRPLRARAHPLGPSRRRPRRPARHVLLRGGELRTAGDRRGGALRRAGVQRPDRLPHRLGAVPRLPDRHRPRRSLRAALRRDGGGLGSPDRGTVGRCGRRLRDPRRGRVSARARAELYVIAVAIAALALFTHVLLLVLGLGFVFSPARPRRRRPRAGAAVGRSRVRARSRHARLHGARDRGEPRRRGARARQDPAPEPLRRDRSRRSRDGGVRPRRRVRPRPPHRSWRPRFSPSSTPWRARCPAGPWTRSASSSGSARPSSSSPRSRRRISGAGRLAYALGRHGMLPHAFARLNRRTLLAPAAIVTAAGLACALLVAVDAAGRDVRFFGSLYSFGILLALTAAQVAVLRLRFTEPGLDRPYRAPWNVTIRDVRVPVARSSRGPAHLRALDRRHGDARGGARRRADLGGAGRRRLRRGPPHAPRGVARPRQPGRAGPRPGGTRRVRARARPAQDRA